MDDIETALRGARCSRHDLDFVIAGLDSLSRGKAAPSLLAAIERIERDLAKVRTIVDLHEGGLA